MKPRAIHLYVGLICLAGLAVQPLLNWYEFMLLGERDLLGLAALIGLGLVSESLALSMRFGGSSGNSSITFIPLLACVLVFGPAPAIVFIATTVAVVEFLIRKKEVFRATFNLGQFLLSAAIAGIAFQESGGVAQVFTVATSGHFQLQIVPIALFGIGFLFLNQAFVSIAVALHQGLPIRTVLVRMIGTSGTNILYDLAVAPIAVAVGFLYVELSITGLLVALLPLYFIRHSYLISYRLQQANRDLLKALVKAIETRDPYTSGHSMRVASLAREIAEGLGLPKKRVEAIETAALLHDIGKIDADFTSLLRKPGSLTPEERAVIQSHVTRGVELLSNLASYPTEILDAVRYHHERLDGTGYPDGLAGDAIPLAARIISTCDAIDAMLSDRPYRRALAVECVEAELVSGEGTQFDTRIVQCIVENSMLPRHKTKVESVQADAVPAFVIEADAADTPKWFAAPGARKLAGRPDSEIVAS